MKKFDIKVLFVLMSIGLIAACNQDKKDKIIQKKDLVLTGKVDNLSDTTLAFSYYTYDLLDNLQREQVRFDKNGAFKLKMNSAAPIKGWFSFGKVPVTEEFTFTNIKGRDSIIKTGTFDFQMVYFYLSPGDSVQVSVDRNHIQNTLRFSGDAVDDNKFVNMEDNMFNDYKHKFLNNWYNVANRQPNDYKRVIDEHYEEKIAFLQQAQDTMELSKTLVNFYKNNYYADKVGDKLNYPGINSSYNNNEPVVLPENYYGFMNDVDMSEGISKNGVGYFYNLRTYLNKKYELETANSAEKPEFYSWLSNELPEEQRYEYMAYSLGSDFSRRLYDEFDANSPFPEMAAVVREKYKDLEGMMEGNPAPSVSFKDMEGNTVSIDDFKGKYAYIDLWATWCGPCIKEMPSLKKLQEKYKDANIDFISVSIDDKKDHDKWKNFVKNEDLLGLQLIADKENYGILSKAFNIKMIPRFILLDPEGNIVDATAPFPSDPKLEALFDQNNI